MWVVLFLALMILMAAGIIGVLVKKIDRALNFSMKKKIKVRGIPLYFPNDRKNESKLGKTLENPNEGVYLPTFICSLITYFIVLLAIIYSILVFTVEIPKPIVNGLMYGFLGIMIVYGVIIDGLLYHYNTKYINHQEEWKEKIRNILDENEK